MPRHRRPKSDNAAGVFDDDKPAAKDKTAGQAGRGRCSDRDTIGFTQENATAQMTELEERMFRLSEALRGLEPENASRLRLALKFSREELILEQMRDTHKMLKEAQLAKAETEIRELLAKLEHLRNVLLAEDLDFQLKLARLRQMRETLGQLERIVKDQRRELGWSRFALDQRKAKEKLAARRPDLEALARDQKKVLDDTRALATEKTGDRKAAQAALRDREAAIGKAASALAADPVFADFQPSQLRKAEAHLGEAAAHLGRDGDDLAGAVAPEEKAEAVLREELKGTRRTLRRGRSATSPGQNSASTRPSSSRPAGPSEALGAASARLGDAGVALQKDLIRAGGSHAGGREEPGPDRP